MAAAWLVASVRAAGEAELWAGSPWTSASAQGAWTALMTAAVSPCGRSMCRTGLCGLEPCARPNGRAAAEAAGGPSVAWGWHFHGRRRAVALPGASMLCGCHLSLVARGAGSALGSDHEKGAAAASAQDGAAMRTLRRWQSFALLGTPCSWWRGGKPAGLRAGP